MKARTLIGLVLLAGALAAEGSLLALAFPPASQAHHTEVLPRPTIDIVFMEGDEYVHWKGLRSTSTWIDSGHYERWRDQGFRSPWEGSRGIGQVSFERDAYRAWEADGFPARGEGDRVIDEGERVVWVRDGVLTWEEQFELDDAWSIQSEGGPRRSPPPGRTTWAEFAWSTADVCRVEGEDGPLLEAPSIVDSAPVGKRITVGGSGTYTIGCPQLEGYLPIPPLEVVVAPGSHQVCEVELQRAP